MGRLTRAQIQEIITTYKYVRSFKGTAQETGRSVSVVKRWVRRWQARTVDMNRHAGGRKRALSEAAAEIAAEMLLSGRFPGGKAVAQELHSEGHTTTLAHRKTVVRAAREAALKVHIPLRVLRGRPRAALKAATKEKRIQFAEKHKNRDWSNVLFTDRKKFHFRYPGVRVHQTRWVIAGQPDPGVPRASHPLAFNIYAGLCLHGATKPHAVAGTSHMQTKHKTKRGNKARNITASEYVEVLNSTLLPQAKQLFSKHGVTFWIFQQDNDPSHKEAAATIAAWRRATNTRCELLIEWPPSSPDLNPIENLWSWVERRVEQRGCKTFADFKAAVMEELANVPKEICEALVHSMKRRLELVIENGGDRTGY